MHQATAQQIFVILGWLDALFFFDRLEIIKNLKLYKHKDKVKMCLSRHQHLQDAVEYNGVSLLLQWLIKRLLVGRWGSF